MIKWFSDEGLIDIRKKDPTSIQKSGKALFCKSKNKMSDGNNFYISGPCRSFYDYDYDKNGNKIFNFKIVYLTGTKSLGNIVQTFSDQAQ